MFRKYGIIGLMLISFSFILSIFDIGNSFFYTTIPLGTIFFTTGFWLFSDAIDYALNKSSVLHTMIKKHRIFFYLILVGIVIGIIFDFYGILISKLWEWYGIGKSPVSTIFFYFFGLTFGYGIPLLMYYSFYRVLLHLIKKEFPERFGIQIQKRKMTKKMFRYLLVIGIASLCIPLFAYPFFIAQHTPFIGTGTFFLVLIGLWFILEYIEHKRNERTLLEDIIKGEWRPMIGIIIAAVLTAFLWEGINGIANGRGGWTYTNLLWQQVTLFGIPLEVVLGWIPLYIIYLSFYRAVIKGNDKIWKV